MTAVVSLSPRARLDLFEIVQHLLAVGGHRTASEWHDNIWKRIDQPKDFPGTGSPRPKLGRDVRIALVDPYIIIHRHALGSDEVDVLRVVHGRRKITRKLVREGEAE